ncbi:MAG: hypothetical protein ACRCZZ_08045 [Phocaeicola sp.]
MKKIWRTSSLNINEWQQQQRHRFSSSSFQSHSTPIREKDNKNTKFHLPPKTDKASTSPSKIESKKMAL